MFSTLSENAQRLLCIYAYHGMGSQKSLRELKSLLSKYYDDFPYDGMSVEDELKAKGMLVNRGYSWYSNQYNYAIPDNFFVPAILYTLTERKDIAEVLEKMHLSRAFMHQYTRGAVTQLVESGFTTCSHAAMIPPEEARFFAPVSTDVRFKPLFTCMSKETFESFFIDVINKYIENDIATPSQYVESLLNDNIGLTLPQKLKLRGYLELYAYISEGVLPQHEMKMNDSAGLALVAIHHVIHGKYAEAVKAFQLSLKVRNKTSNNKNMYMSSLVNYYLMVAYAYEGSPESLTKLKQFLNKNNVSDYHIFVPSRIVAEQTLSTGKEWHKEGVEGLMYRALNKTTTKTLGLLAYLLNRYYELGASSDVYSADHFKPNLLLLRHELSEYIELTVEERQQLKDLFGPQAGLTAIRHKAEWELSLERLLSIGSVSDQTPEEKNVRIMYVMHYMGSGIEVREQTRLKNGQWGSGKTVGMARFLACEVECMDEADRRIVNRMLSSRSYELRLEHVIEEMTGESRLYIGRYAPYTEMEVFEDKPYIIVNRVGDEYEIRSNVPKKGIADDIIITKATNERIEFIKLPDVQKAIYKELLHIGHFPLEAEPTLRAALAHVGGKVEIHSELVEGGSTLPIVKGQSKACVQLNPTSDGYYSLTISAHPLVDGRRYCSLGKGDTKFVDETEGKRVWVERDMKEEKKVAKLFKTFFKEQEENPDVDFHDPEVMLDADSKLELDPYEMLTILEFIQEHPEQMYAEWPEGKKSKIRTIQKSDGSWSGTLHERGMWFQLEGEVQIDENTVMSMSQLLELVSMSRGKYIKLGENEFLALSDKLHRQLRALEAVAHNEKGVVQMSPFSAALLGDEALNGDIQIFMSNNLVELRKRIMDSANYKPEVPAELKAKLRPYQVDGYQWIARLNSWGAGALLADDMGLGKTVQTIAFLLLKAKEGASLVVAPASVAPNWKVEFEKFAPSLNAIILNFAQDRKEVIKNAGPNDVVITTYGILLSEHETINDRKWNVACLDEAHIIKNRGAKTSAAAMKIQADNRVILTGTPVQNHLSELWSLFQFINPGLLGGYEVFSRKFITPIERDQDMECQKRLDRVVHPFMLRRTKNAVLQELPEKTEIYQNIELSQEEMAVYEVIRQKAEKLLENQQMEDQRLDFNVLAEITRLRQAACSAQLIEKNWSGQSSKVTALIELLQEVIEGGNRALVFSQFTSFFDIVRKTLDEAGMEYLYIDGSVPVKKRTELVERFQKGECPLFLISLKAGGLGLNLTNANYVFHLDPWWNPAIEQQATDRAYRIGQNQAVTVYHLISQNTIEEKIIRLHQSKRQLAENILEGTDITHKLTGKDLLELCKR